MDGQPVVIDGWLRDDAMLLKPRRGTPSSDWQGRRARDLPLPTPTPTAPAAQ